MKEHEALIKERVNDWLAAFSPGNETFDFSVLSNLYWQDEQLLVFDWEQEKDFVDAELYGISLEPFQ